MRSALAAVCAVFSLLTTVAHAQQIFWTDTLGRSVYTAGFDGSNPHAIVTDLPVEPSSIAVDPLAGKLYIALDGTTNQVWRTNLDGAARQIVFNNDDGPDAIALDPAGGKMYLALEDTQSIKRADLDGANPQTLHTIPNALFTAIMVDPLRAQLYWLDRQDNLRNSVLRSSTSGGPIEAIITEPAPSQTFGNLFGLAMDSANGHIYLLDEDDTRIFRLNLNGDILAVLHPDGAMHPRGLALRPEADQMFWVQGNGIFRSDLNGENVTPIVGSEEDGIFPLSIAVVPEPATWLLAVLGLLAQSIAVLVWARRRR